ncbi:MAG: hypothetical protein IJW25_00615 [Clostridia bacterium]|nr:hypothetical protein [Clostridia bacterium]
MTLIEVLLYILSIIGLVVLGVMIVYFLSVLVLSIIGRNENGTNNVNSQSRPKVLASNEGDAEEFTLEEEKTWNDEKAKEEQNQIQTLEETLEAEEPVSMLEDERQENLAEKRKIDDDFDDFDSIFDDDIEDEEDTKEDAELEKLIDQINAECVEEYNKLAKAEPVKAMPVQAEPEEVIEPVFEEEDENDIFVEDQINLFDDLGLDDENQEEETVENNEEIEAMKAELEQERERLEQERQALIKEREELEAQKDELANRSAEIAEGSIYDNMTMEQLYERLEVLRTRLKANEKDLKANRKEYNPLAKVKKTLEKDKAKLRRKEAIVARKKVILYGVNNYVDIDEEKAKKLSEDLDLLDGLRLSVQHCEDVMNANKDRFPILEKTNQILVETNKNIHDDINEIEKVIASRTGNIVE